VWGPGASTAALHNLGQTGVAAPVTGVVPARRLSPRASRPRGRGPNGAGTFEKTLKSATGLLLLFLFRALRALGIPVEIDWQLYFHDELKKTKQIIFSVKSGHTSAPHVRDLVFAICLRQ
jgi:hypothetical protein